MRASAFHLSRHRDVASWSVPRHVDCRDVWVVGENVIIVQRVPRERCEKVEAALKASERKGTCVKLYV